MKNLRRIHIFNDGRSYEQKKIYNRNTIWYFDPGAFVGMKNLTEINMPYLDMHGHITSEFVSALQNLRYLNLAHNRIDYDLPHDNWSPLLEIIELNDNRLQGRFPKSWITSLPNLQYVSVANTRMGNNGQYPLEILSGSQQLKAIDMANCSFGGVFPWEYFNPEQFQQLEYVAVNFNAKIEMPDICERNYYCFKDVMISGKDANKKIFLEQEVLDLIEKSTETFEEPILDL